MTEYTSKFRVYPTPYLFDKIFTISPEYTWDLKNFVLSLSLSSNKSDVRNSRARLPTKTKTSASQSLLKPIKCGRKTHQTCLWTSTITMTDFGIL